jgi:hypothetical protein
LPFDISTANPTLTYPTQFQQPNVLGSYLRSREPSVCLGSLKQTFQPLNGIVKEEIIVKGHGHILVCDSHGSNINLGDLLTSSSIWGHATKQGDDIVHNYSIARSTTICDFSTDGDAFVFTHPVTNNASTHKRKLLGCIFL